MIQILQIFLALIGLKARLKGRSWLLLVGSLILINSWIQWPSQVMLNVASFLLVFSLVLLNKYTASQATYLASLSLAIGQGSQIFLDFLLNQIIVPLSPASLARLVWLTSLLITYLVARLIYQVDQQLNQHYFWSQHAYLLAFVLFILSQRQALISDYAYIAFRGIMTYQFLLTSLLILALIFIVLITITDRNQRHLETINEIRLQDQIQADYARLIQDQHLEMRQFRHDYHNIMWSLEAFIQTEDWQGLTNFYRQELLGLLEGPESQHVLTAIARIKNPLIQNLLNVKISLALNQGIEVSLEVPETIEITQTEILPLIRVLGSLLDNAIEGAESLAPDQGPQIHLAIMTIDQYEVIVIKNSFAGSVQDLNQLSQPGYSSKGQGRGLGLATVSSIVNQNPGLNLRTSIQGGYFSQELIIQAEVD